jgi:cell division protein FtsB
VTTPEPAASQRVGPRPEVTRQLATAITGKDDDPTNLRRRWGVISAINTSDLTVDVNVDGVILPHIKRVATYIPIVGDTVRVDVNGTDILVVGSTVTATNDLSSIPPAIQANASSISSVNSVVTGHTVQISSTTQAVTGLQDKVNGTTVKFQTQAVAAQTVAATGAISGASSTVTGQTAAKTAVIGSDKWSLGTDGLGNPSALSPAGGAGLVSTGGTLYVVQSGNTINHAPLAATDITGTSLNLGANGGRVDCGQIWAGNTHTLGLNVNGGLTVGGDSGVAYAQIITQDITATRNMACQTIFYTGGQLPASERSLKEHIEDLDDPFPFLNALRPSRFKWIDTEHHDDQTHVGVYVDEMAEADPDTVISMEEMPVGMFGTDEEKQEEVERYNRNVGRRPDERSLIAYLSRAAQVLKETVDRQSQQIEDLQAHVRALHAK